MPGNRDYIQSEKNTNTLESGKIISVRGSVVDIWFERDLPPVYSLLFTGEKEQVSIEILTQPDANTVRGIALNPTQGLSRGMAAYQSGGGLTVPVGPQIMGRMFDVFGNTIDKGGPRMLVNRARQLERFFTQSFFTTEQFSGTKGKEVSLEAALDGCERILADEFKDVPEDAFYMIGSVDEVKKNEPSKVALNGKQEKK